LVGLEEAVLVGVLFLLRHWRALNMDTFRCPTPSTRNPRNLTINGYSPGSSTSITAP
jgi:hypothetical protein